MSDYWHKIVILKFWEIISQPDKHTANDGGVNWSTVR